jgi:hypothetical protein
MMRWVRFAGVTIYRTPVLMTALLLMLTAWIAAAQIYEAAIQVRGHGETAAMMLAGLNLVYSWVLVHKLSAAVADMQELRLPQHRQLFAVGLVFIFGFIFVLPCLLVWSLNGGARDVVMIAMGAFAGAAGALLWRMRIRAYSASAGRESVLPAVRSVPVQVPKPWRAVCIALGPPYAPASWQRRTGELTLLCVIIVSAPLLTLLYQHSLRPRVFDALFHGAEFLGYLAAIALCWVWPLSRLLAIFNHERGALTELALLPGLGSGRQQLRRLLLVTLSVPSLGLLLLMISALVLVTLQQAPHGIYLKLILEFLLVPLVTVPILIAHLAKVQMTPIRSTALLMASQTWTLSLVVWSGIWDVGAGSPLGHRLRALSVGILLIALAVIIGFSMHSLRKLLRRPHPFVEVSA